MATTPRLNLQYPDEGEDPFFLKIKSFFEGVDSYVYANGADRNLILTGGGTISFNSGSGVVTWSADMVLIDYASGYSIMIAASSLTVSDGQAAIIDTNRLLSQNVNATASAVSYVGNSQSKIVLFARRGTKVLFRNGAILAAGADAPILTSGPSGEVRFGTATFGGVDSYVDVVFGTPLADASYRVVGLVADAAFALYAPVAQKTSGGFRIATVSATVPSVGVKADWKVERS